MLILANKIMKMAEVPKIYITEKQDDPWNGERPSQDVKENGQNLFLPIGELVKG